MSAKERLDILKERLDDLFTENQRLKQLCDRYEEEHNTTFEEWKKTINIINELEKWLESENNFWKEQQEKAIKNGWLEFGGKYNTTIIYENVINKLQELKGSDSNENL